MQDKLGVTSHQLFISFMAAGKASSDVQALPVNVRCGYKLHSDYICPGCIADLLTLTSALRG